MNTDGPTAQTTDPIPPLDLIGMGIIEVVRDPGGAVTRTARRNTPSSPFILFDIGANPAAAAVGIVVNDLGDFRRG